MASVFLRVELATGEYLDRITLEATPGKGDLIALGDGTRFIIDELCHTPYRRRDQEAVLLVSPWPVGKDVAATEPDAEPLPAEAVSPDVLSAPVKTKRPGEKAPPPEKEESNG